MVRTPVASGGSDWREAGHREYGKDHSLSGAQRIAITEDRQSAFIALSTGAQGRLIRWDLGNGILNNFTWDEDVVLDVNNNPRAIWLP